MEPEGIAALVAGLVLLVGIGIGRRRRAALRTIERRVDVLTGQLGLQDAIHPEPSELALELLAQGRKIDAIRTYREDHPGLGLKAAKEAIEAWERGGTHVPSPDSDRIVRKLDTVLRSFDLEVGDGSPHVSDDVRHLARDGKKLEAIRQLRHDNPGLGLAEAKDTVERL